MKKKIPALVMMVSASSLIHAALVSSLTQTAGQGGNIDLTSTSTLAWGYYEDGLLDGITNNQTGTGSFVPSVINTGENNDTRTYGYTFTYSDGTSPASGTSSALSGGLRGLSGQGPQLTFSGLVTSQTRTLTLYFGGYDTGTMAVNIGAELQNGGGTVETDAGPETFDVTATRGAGNYAHAVYTLDFSSATATDVYIDVDFSSLSGTSNFGFAGYTVTAIPEPSSMALIGLATVAILFLKRRT